MKTLFVTLLSLVTLLARGQGGYDYNLPLKIEGNISGATNTNDKSMYPRNFFPFEVKKQGIGFGDTLKVRLSDIDPPVKDLLIEIELCYGNCYSNLRSSGKKTKGDLLISESLQNLKDNTLSIPITYESEVKDELDNNRTKLRDNTSLEVIFVSIKNGTRSQVKYRVEVDLIKKPVEVSEYRTPEIYLPNLQGAKYHALLIGVNNYRDPSLQLRNPKSDVLKLEKILREKYEFSTITRMIDPTKKALKDTLAAYAYKLFRDDNLLIFFAGHGAQSDRGMGVWALQDARNGDFDSYFSNESLISLLKFLTVQHLLVVTDACYGSGLIQSRQYGADDKDVALYGQLYGQRSRKVLSSSHLAEIPDSSAFINYFVRRLTENEEEYLTAEELFESVKLPIHNRTAGKQTPKFGDLLGLPAGNGAFLFRRKNAASPPPLVLVGNGSGAETPYKPDNDILDVPYIRVLNVDRVTGSTTRGLNKGMPETGARIKNSENKKIDIQYQNPNGEWRTEFVGGGESLMITFDRARLNIRIRNGAQERKQILDRGYMYKVSTNPATGTLDVQASIR
ncbi:caspase family protein [Larkinella soli]|uniref:caspase family protein n=1 Tax=Larkinella soli TaxID=1770527 RepID=UPI0013E357E3|nr:caspase family protein [Larkinella soli]